MAKKVETKVLGRKKAEKEMTLLRAIEQVVEVSRDSKLKAEAKAEMAAEVRYIAGRYGITERQAILFSICMEKGPRRVDFDDLARHLDVSSIKALFNRYREQVNRHDASAAPILLFNEADAIIGIRKQGAQSAVDKMENSIQNIILQEMETLDGILIATTNLTQNLDSAFERRFLYKIKFEKPDATVRKCLWRSTMPSLSEADAQVLATGFDFSGGQIENISRKATINAILHGEEANDVTRLTSFCKAERMDSEAATRRISF